jgi:PPOX class probable F420-dependent enzyme|tara:strand:+ start:2017 stop:2394 length:378 start_codon:yes stop_codon:yes gene_type:complete
MNLKNFTEAEYINLITYKRDKSSVTTPVWVADFSNSLVVTTSLNAGKVKRVRNNGKATIYITNQNGSKKLSESLDLKATLIEDLDLKKQATDLIRKKYGMMAKMIMKGPDEKRAIIKLEEIGGEK